MPCSDFEKRQLMRRIAELEWRLADAEALGLAANPVKAQALRDHAVAYLASLAPPAPVTPTAHHVAAEIAAYERRNWEKDKQTLPGILDMSPKRQALFSVMRYSGGSGLRYRKIMEIIVYCNIFPKIKNAQKSRTLHISDATDGYEGDGKNGG